MFEQFANMGLVSQIAVVVGGVGFVGGLLLWGGRAYFSPPKRAGGILT